MSAPNRIIISLMMATTRGVSLIVPSTIYSMIPPQIVSASPPAQKDTTRTPLIVSSVQLVVRLAQMIPIALSV
jgi:hypothetical protein